MIYIHLGYPKAGSTTLQKALFLHHSDVVNLGLYPQSNVGKDSVDTVSDSIPYLNDLELRDFYWKMLHLDGMSYCEATMQDDWKRILNKYNEVGKSIVLSNEGFLSSRFSNPEIFEKIRRLKSVIPDARIFIVIRNQLDLLKSLYRDHPFDPRTLKYQPSPVSFECFIKADLEMGCHNNINTLFYSRLYKLLVSMFRKENVCILPLEMLRDYPSEFAYRLSGFMNIDSCKTIELLNERHENLGPTEAQNLYRFIKSTLTPVLRLIPGIKRWGADIDASVSRVMRNIGATQKVSVSNEVHQLIRRIYADENKWLANELEISLSEYGYPIN